MGRRRLAPDEEVAPRAWAGLAVVAAAMFVATLDAMVLYVAFGTIRRDFPDVSALARRSATRTPPATAVVTSARRVMELATLPSRHHVDDRPRMERHEDEVGGGEQGEQHEPHQMNRACT